ncbi:MBL fold metallo-hydrolase [Oceanobacillus halophilus]|uniref:MBL fold metallo-hydrolase n=1 Tax=Oceanobacillus halophilus TaxID=930130 RepID=A0A494ZV84_9BACI|nr:MBL fold metallo-hydrolase [Oceanobacillus halophilus]RKQ30371.1 MBL fold metallo-hydrolase [Oceanobacillus halophilus]
MKRKDGWLFVISIISFVLLMGCASDASSDNAEKEESNQVEASSSTSETNEETEEEVENSVDMKVTLLGTGSPVLSMERLGNSTLVEVGDERLLFDVGRGAALRLDQIDISPGMIDKLFVTHLHHDHTVGFADLLITAAVPDPRGNREGDLQVWGPEGTENFVNSTIQAFEVDINTRKQVEGASGLASTVHEIEEGIVYENNGVEVIAFNVDHGPMKPALGYRINYKGRSVVISGDTTYSENLIKHAKDADLLVQEVVVVKGPDEEYQSEAHKNIEAYHTTPEQAGELFKEIDPSLAVFTHIATFLPEHEATIVDRTKAIYDGEVELGEDLMSIEVGEEVTISE